MSGGLELDPDPDYGRRTPLGVLVAHDQPEAVAEQLQLSQLHRHLLQPARELERHVVVARHRRTRVLAHVEALVQRDADRDRALDPPLRDLRAIDAERAGAALAYAAAVVAEVELDPVPASSTSAVMRNDLFLMSGTAPSGMRVCPS